jgi:hypothetical protein
MTLFDVGQKIREYGILILFKIKNTKMNRREFIEKNSILAIGGFLAPNLSYPLYQPHIYFSATAV